MVALWTRLIHGEVVHVSLLITSVLGTSPASNSSLNNTYTKSSTSSSINTRKKNTNSSLSTNTKPSTSATSTQHTSTTQAASEFTSTISGKTSNTTVSTFTKATIPTSSPYPPSTTTASKRKPTKKSTVPPPPWNSSSPSQLMKPTNQPYREHITASRTSSPDINKQNKTNSSPNHTGLIVAIVLLSVVAIIVGVIGGFIYKRSRNRKKKPLQKKPTATKAKLNRTSLKMPKDLPKRRRGPRDPNADPDADISMITTESLMNRLSERRNEFFAQTSNSSLDSTISNASVTEKEPEAEKSAKSAKKQTSLKQNSQNAQEKKAKASVSSPTGSPGHKEY